MSNNQNQEGKLVHATRVLCNEMTELRKRLAKAEGEERAHIEAKIKSILASLGFETLELTTDKPTGEQAQGEEMETIGAKLAAGIRTATEEAAKITGKNIEVETKVTVEEPGLWARFKAWISNNKTKCVLGALTVTAVAVGVWYWLSGRTSTATVVNGMTDVAVETTETTTVADPTIFAKVGEWVVRAASNAKSFFVSAYEWVKGLFTRRMETVVETTTVEPTVVPA